MIAHAKLTVPAVAMFTFCTTLEAETVLFDRQVDLEQKTEVRFDAPDGCVITGLGLRAHYDNFTTMLCRYHKLNEDATLSDPCEVRLGSEPNHACEATIMLPENYVMVGMGGAGEPEWDITVLRVWARKLNGDGTLGPVKVFSNGFKPERGTEQEFKLTQMDRAITGVGIRFSFNDVSGMYVRSERVLNINDRQRRKITQFTERGWLLQAPRSIHPDLLSETILDYKITRLDIDFSDIDVFDADALRWCEKEIAAAHKAGARCFGRLNSVDTRTVISLLQKAPALSGIVINVNELGEDEFGSGSIARVRWLCAAAGKSLSLRIDPATCPDVDIITEMVQAAPPDVELIVRYANLLPGASQHRPDLSVYGNRRIIAEINMMGPQTKSNLADIRINEMPGLVVDAALAGAGGFTTCVNVTGGYLPTSMNEMNLQALHRLSDDPFTSVDGIWTDLCEKRYGRGAEKAVQALKRTNRVNELIFTIFGEPVIWTSGRFFDMDQVEERIAEIESPEVRSELLEPTDKTAGRVSGEHDTANWLLVQSKADAEAVAEAAPSEEASTLAAGMDRLGAANAYMQKAALAYTLARTYAINGAAQTRAAAAMSLAGIKEPPQDMLNLSGNADGFAESVTASLNDSDKNAVLTKAFDRIRNLNEQNKAEEATEDLSKLFESEKLVPHLASRMDALASVASGLKTLWSVPENLEFRWGADGKWTVRKAAGKWSCYIGPDRPCLYLNVPGEKLSEPADYVVGFEYLDKGDWTIHFEYDSDYPDSRRRQYHPVEPLKLTDTGKWKSGSFELKNCLFSSGMNLQADMRFITGSGACIRNIELKEAE